MKKLILLSMFAQFCWVAMKGTDNNKKNTVQLKTQKFKATQKTISFLESKTNQPFISYKAKKLKAPVGEVVGRTTYDLQTNYGVCRRVATNSSGTFTYVGWTMGLDYTASDTGRGTGFNFYNSNTGKWQPVPTIRIEPESKSGWPSIGFSQGRQISITHTTGVLFTYKDENQSDWKEIKVGDIVNDRAGFWARAAIEPPNIYVVIGRFANSNADPVAGGINFIRSTDNGDTWESMGGLEANYAETYPRPITSDSYQIDAANGIISVVVGNALSQIVIYKSVDKGDTWQKNIIQSTSNPLVKNINNNTGEQDYTVEPFFASNGGITVIIDSNGKSHVIYSGQIQFNTFDNDFVSTGFHYSLEATSALFYWNEDMGTPKIIGKSILNDNNGDGDLGSALNRMLSVGAPFYSDIVAHPQLAIDSEDNLYVSYSSAVDGHFVPEKIEFESSDDGGETIETFIQEFPPNSLSYYDVFMLRSTNGGLNWQGPLNITNAPESEETYPSIPRFIHDTIFLVYHHDVLPGTFLQSPQIKSNINEVAVVKILPRDINDEAAPMDSEPYLSVLSNAYILPQHCNLDKDIYLRNNAWGLDYPEGIIQDIKIEGEADYSTVGSYTEIVYVEDSAGNQSDTLQVSIEVIPDDLPPEIEFDRACTKFAIIAGSEWSTPKVNITDYVTINGEKTESGCDITENLRVEDNVNANEVGTYTVLYTVTDFAENEDRLEITVNVILEDTEGPGADVTGLPEIIGLLDPFDPADVKVVAIDNVDCENIEVDIQGLDDINTKEIGDYPIIITLTDQSGNTTIVERTIKVGDNTAPTIILNGAYTIVVAHNDCGEDGVFDMDDDPWVSASDDIDGDLTGEVIADYGGSINCGVYGEYIITYSVSDQSGNEAFAERTVIVPIVGIEDNPAYELVDIYPNPTKGFLNIETTSLQVSGITVYNLIGKTILSLNDKDVLPVTKIDLSDKPEGIYMVNVVTNEGTVTRKVNLAKK